MKITILGAAGGEVTGSAYLVDTGRARVLVDCGQFQGHHVEALNRPPLDAGAPPPDAVVLTHAHLDHTGRLPLLVRTGFRGPIWATPATIDMTGLILRDAAKVQAQDAERHNRARQRAGEAPAEPLFTLEDVEQILKQLRPMAYHQPFDVAPGLRVRAVEAGHMLGSASLEIVADADGRRTTAVFSGDLGPKGAPILRDAERFARADLVFLESTYGDRDHQPFADTVQEFIAILQEAVAQRSKVLVPTFAVGRAQLLTALLAWIFRNRRVEPFPVFLDSPMAIEATHIYERHPELYDEEMLAFLKARPVAKDLATMKLTATPAESRQINACAGPCLIMAGAGMCNAGRILHHLRHNLWNPEAHVVIAGYQGGGTLGRQLVDGAGQVSIFGEPVAVKARIHTLGGFSAHAGQTELAAWFAPLAASRPRLVLTHGEDPQRAALAALLAKAHGITALLPALGDSVEL